MTINLFDNLIIYRSLSQDSLLCQYREMYEKYREGTDDASRDEYSKLYYGLCSRLMYGGYDSINEYISEKILCDENLFSLSCERGADISEKITKAVFHDIAVIKKVFMLPFRSMATMAKDAEIFLNYGSDTQLTELIKNGRSDQIYDYLRSEYAGKGCGIYRSGFAFSVDDKGKISVVNDFEPVPMEHIYGYKVQKQRIIDNTEKFITKGNALNGLLIGDSGTGKSTTVKALLPMFRHRKLRLIELKKSQLSLIPAIVEKLKARGLYFIIFIDDLSFESNEDSYKYLKSAVEGSIYEQPENILFYVTSNRKHLIKESMTERESEVHVRDAVNEQTSLSDRFGLRVYYNEPDQDEYFEIVSGLAQRYGVAFENTDELLAGAKMFAMQNGGRTGRSALQYIKTL